MPPPKPYIYLNINRYKVFSFLIVKVLFKFYQFSTLNFTLFFTFINKTVKMKQVDTKIQNLLSLENSEIWQYVNSGDHQKLIELSAKINGLKSLMDTIINHYKMDKRLEIQEQQNTVEEKLLSVPYVADKLGFSKVTIYDKIKRGDIEAVKIGSKWKISTSELRRQMKGKNV